jgi:hypothetical protein
MRHVAAAVPLLALLAVPAAAEDAAAGTPPTIRVQLRNQSTVQGYLRGKSTDELVVYTDGKYRHVPLTDVQRLDVRTRTGTHAKRGALIGVVVWASLMTAARFGALDEAGFASWQSGAILVGGVGLGALAGSHVPRYGWRETELRSVRIDPPVPLVRFTLRF